MIKEYYGNKYFKDFLHPLIKPISKKQKYIIAAPIPKLLKIKFLEKISQLYKKFFHPTNVKRNFLFAQYKNHKFIIR